MIDSFSFTLAAGVPARLNASGEFFRLLDGSGVNVTFMVSGARVGTAYGMNGGFFARSRVGEPFDSVEMVSATAQTVTFLVGNAESGAASSVSVSGTVEVNSAARVMSQSAPAVGLVSVLLLAANPARRFLLVQNNNVALNLWLNLDGNAATTAGVKIPPGGSILLDSACPSGAVYAIGEGAVNNFVAVVEG